MKLRPDERAQLFALLSQEELRRAAPRIVPRAKPQLAARIAIQEATRSRLRELWRKTSPRGKEEYVILPATYVDPSAVAEARVYLPANQHENRRYGRLVPALPVEAPADGEGVFAPQPGRQTDFLSAEADIVIYGGGAGSGKTRGLLLDVLRHIATPGFRAIFFRRNLVQITNPDGLWDEAQKIYPRLGARPNEQRRRFRFPWDTSIDFRHLESEATKFSYQGMQVAWLGFDELTHFTKTQFLYLLTRLRSTAGVRPAVRATCNADGESWVADLVAWWIDPDSGYPIPERAGVLRWLVARAGVLYWGDSPAELRANYPDLWRENPQLTPLSFTFIPALLTDNMILQTLDPGYRSRLDVQDEIDRERLLNNNWKIRRAQGKVFLGHWFKRAPEMPAGLLRLRSWDLAATEKDFRQNRTRGPDYTAYALGGVRYTRRADGGVEISELYLQLGQGQLAPANVLGWIRYYAERERDVKIVVEREPGAAAKILGEELESEMARIGCTLVSRPARDRGSKVQGAILWSKLARAGSIYLVDSSPAEPYDVRPLQYDEIIATLEHFPDPAYHDDLIDAISLLYVSAVDALETDAASGALSERRAYDPFAFEPGELR